jgi:hypothetical protein
LGLARRDRKGSLNDGRIQNPSKPFGIVPLSRFVPRGFGFVHHSIAILYHEVPNPDLTIRHFWIAVGGHAAHRRVCAVSVRGGAGPPTRPPAGRLGGVRPVTHVLPTRRKLAHPCAPVAVTRAEAVMLPAWDGSKTAWAGEKMAIYRTYIFFPKPAPAEPGPVPQKSFPTALCSTTGACVGNALV